MTCDDLELVYGCDCGGCAHCAPAAFEPADLEPDFGDFAGVGSASPAAPSNGRAATLPGHLSEYLLVAGICAAIGLAGVALSVCARSACGSAGGGRAGGKRPDALGKYAALNRDGVDDDDLEVAWLPGGGGCLPCEPTFHYWSSTIRSHRQRQINLLLHHDGMLFFETWPSFYLSIQSLSPRQCAYR
jgi:hypothetical protein